MLITLNQLKTSLQAVISYISSVLPTKVSDLDNDSGFLTDVEVNGTSVVSNNVANVPLATDSSVGVIKADPNTGAFTDANGKLYISKASDDQIKTGANVYRSIPPNKADLTSFYGLAKAAGDTTQASSSNPVGTYTDDAKSAIKSMLGFLTDTDYATDQTAGIVRVNNAYGIAIGQNGLLSIDPATSTEIKSGTTLKPLVPIKQHASVFYGLAKVAGDTTQAASSNAVGTYTEEAKTAIKSMLDISDLDVQINGTSIVNNGVANIPYASLANAGVIKIEPNDGGHLGMSINSAGFAFLSPAVSDEIKAGEMYTRRPIIPSTQHESVFYGLAKASGDTTQYQSSNAVGTYTDAAKTAIQNMLGISDGYVTKDSVNNAGISARTYTDLFNGEFSVTTATTSDYLKPYARAGVTGRFNKENMHRVTFNGTEYILKTRMWFDINDNNLKVFEYLGNLNYYIDDVSGVPGGTDSNAPFLIISDLNNNSSIDVLTNTVGTYTIKIEKIIETKKQIPASILYNNYYEPILKNDAGGSTYNGFSIGVNELMNKRGTLALGYGNKISDAFSQAFGTRNIISENNSFAFGDKNIINGIYSLAFGQNINIESGTDVGIGFGYGTKVNCNNMVAMGKLNCIANTTFPNWANGTAYKKGDMVVADYGPATGLTWLCTVTHTSAASGTFMQDCQARYQETGSMGWIMAPSNGDVAFVIGNGQSENLRSNAMKLDFAGNGFFGGSIYVDCNADSTGGTKLATVNDVPDVQINGTSIVNSGVANIPIAGIQTLGVVQTTGGKGVTANSSGLLSTDAANASQVKAGTHANNPIVPARQHESVFYGLAKAAGDTSQASSNNAVGTYTIDARKAINNMLGTVYTGNVSDGLSIVEDMETGDLYLEADVQDVQINGTSIVSNGVAQIPIANASTAGVAKADPTNGIGVESQNKLYINYAPSDLIKSGTGSYRPITPPKQHESVFYGLAKAAGDTTQSSSSNAVGTYTSGAKTAINTMLGSLSVDDYASSSNIKGGNVSDKYIPPAGQHMAVFYGLAKAAGDITQASSSNSTGTYTDQAKTAIKSMIGVPTMAEIITAVHDSYASAEEVSF